jgi:hypothetical protein
MDQSKTLTVPKRSATLQSKCREIAATGRLLVWPDQKKGGKPEPDSRANVEAFLTWAEIQVIYDEFERRTLVRGMPGTADP